MPKSRKLTSIDPKGANLKALSIATDCVSWGREFLCLGQANECLSLGLVAGE